MASVIRRSDKMLSEVVKLQEEIQIHIHISIVAKNVTTDIPIHGRKRNGINKYLLDELFIIYQR